MPHQPDHYYLVAIAPEPNEVLFRTFRDYLVFLSLTRELVQCRGWEITGFSWLPGRVLLLCSTPERYPANPIVQVMKRYFYWLQIGENPQQGFRLQLLKLGDTQDYLDGLKFIHHQAVESGACRDALAYHWHSYPLYHNYWQMDWLDTGTLLNCYSSNRLLAMDQFRQDMLSPCRSDFQQRLSEQDMAAQLLSDPEGNLTKATMVQEIKSHYHRHLAHDINLSVTARSDGLSIQIYQQSGK